ncbi:MAG: TMEM165/GDT1 family protein [Elusimicrobia bacterium]|nr:TMEM165/GDT1 family protein [Elusimicrobiota bacterium]
MNWTVVAVAIATCFVAELGDKTQLAILSLTASSKSPWSVLAGASLGLIAASILGVLAGRWLTVFVSPNFLEKASAVLFIGVGIWMLIRR